MATFAIALAVFLLSSECSASIQDHCTDISYWDELSYETTSKLCCDTKLTQVCTTKTDKICEDVLELQCEVVAWGECQSTPTSSQGTKCGVKYNDFAHQNCEEVKSSVTHTKKVPECKEVTKNNCVTDWEVDSNGNKVWAGTETCTPVTWEECDIVEKKVEFPTVKTECGVNYHIKWTEFVDATANIVGLESKCEVKKAVNCKHVVVNKCATVVWQECKMEPREECLAKVIHTPTQEKIHRKKCLTGDDKSESDKLLRGQTLNAGYGLVSKNGVYKLTMQVDGNLVVSSIHGPVTWPIGTSGLGAGAYLVLSDNGTLVLYGADGNLFLYVADGNLVLGGKDPVAQGDSSTKGSKVNALVIEDVGQLVLYGDEEEEKVWSGVPNFIREGSYEYLDGKVKSGSDYGLIRRSVGIADSGAQETYKWINKAGEAWTLYPTAEINVLRVGEDSPHYASAKHRTAVFNSTGVSGPGGAFFVFKGAKAGCPVAVLDVSTANAINNNPIGGVTVILSKDGKVERRTTDKSGKVRFNSPHVHGQVVLTAERDGFTMAPVHLTVGAEECQKTIKLSLSPEYTGPARVVLNWGPLPKDLDLHVIQLKDGKEVCHGFYNNQNCGGFNLDVDNQLGGDNGAETVTFSKLEAGSEYMVFVYADTLKDAPIYLPESQARVAFYRDGHEHKQMSVPTQGKDKSHRYWMVACFNSDGEFVGSNRNQLMSSEPTECG